MDFVVVGVALGDWVRGSSLVGVVVGNVGGKTADTVRLVGTGKELTEELGSRADVCRPSEPSSVTSIEIQGQVYQRGIGQL